MENNNLNESGTQQPQQGLYHQVEVRPRDTFKHFLRVDLPGDSLHWSFYTRKKNIAFGLFYLYQPQVSQLVCSNPQSLYASPLLSALPLKPEAVGGEQEILNSECVRELLKQSRALASVECSTKQGTLAPPRHRENSELLTTELKRSLSRTEVSLSKSKSLSKTDSTSDLSTLSADMSPIITGSFEALNNNSFGEFIEILPVTRYDSYETTICGSFTVPLPGTYVLFFDNSFSMHTSKHLFYNAVVAGAGEEPRKSESICAAGWLMKKKRKIIQGWARRWFQIDASGVMSYYEDRASPCKGSVFLPDCTVSIVPGRKLFTVDSGTNTFHLRGLSEEDFNFWIEVISSFKHTGPPNPLGSELKLSVPVKKSPEAILAEKITLAMDRTRAQLALLKKEDSTIYNDAFKSMQEAFDLLKELSKTANVDTLMKDASKETISSFAWSEDVFYDVEEIIISDVSDFGDEEDRIVESEVEEETEEEVFEMVQEFEEKSLIEEMKHLEISRGAQLPPVITFGEEDLIEYRTTLPFPAPPCNISFASVLKKSIGKDTAGASMPVALNEPINLLQRLAEELEYSELLDTAADLTDPLEKLLNVAVFAVSGYASSAYRADRKPFNPLLGETFEYIRGDKGFRFVAEKVSHRPVIVACHAEGRKWRFWQDQRGKSKFWGKSMEIIPQGTIHVEFPETGDHFTWSKVIGCVRNVVMSKKWFENYGEMIVRNERTGDEARITFKESGMFSSSGNEISGAIYAAGRREPSIKITGRWDDQVWKEVESEGEEPLFQALWKANAMPADHSHFYCFTSFACTLNDLPEKLKPHLPPTDTRHRPDQRLLEAGMLDEAEVEKGRLEQRQREARERLDAEGREWTPKWFKFNDNGADGYWTFNGEYWDHRERKSFNNLDLPELW